MRPHGIVREIERHVLLPVEAPPVDKLEAHVLGQHGPDRVEVMGIEALDICIQDGALTLVELRLWPIVGFGGNLA